MDINDTTTHPWYHPYYSLLRDMYHPFLFHNHLYCELSEQKMIEILTERDMYVRAIECKLVYFELTPAERKWVVYLRDCCLFEIHRRKYRHVLADIIRFTHQDLTGTWHTVQLATHSKVMQWLDSNDGAYETGDYQRDVDEYPERLEDSYGQERPNRVENATQFPSLPESETHYFTLPAQTREQDQQTVEFDTTLMEIANAESQTPHSEWVMWPDYPREMLETYPELFEPRTIKSLGRLLSDPEYIQQQYERRHELQLLAERRERVLREYKKREDEEKRKKEEIMTLEQSMEPEQRERARSLGRSDQVLGPHFVGNAIRTALINDQRPNIQIPFAEQATTSQDNRVVITWDEITRAIDIMNDDIQKNMPQLKQETSEMSRLDTSSTTSSSSSSSEENGAGGQASTSLYNTWFIKKPEESSNKYIQPGTYVVPRTLSNINIRRGALNLGTVLEEEEDSEEEQFVRKSKVVIQYCEASTSTSPPPVPAFIESNSDEETASSSLSQPSQVPSKKRPVSYMDDDDDDSITSADLESDSSSEIKYSPLNPNSLEDNSVPSPSPRSSNDPESTISESEIDCTLPEIEPDFMNLPLPETPDEKEKK